MPFHAALQKSIIHMCQHWFANCLLTNLFEGIKNSLKVCAHLFTCTLYTTPSMFYKYFFLLVDVRINQKQWHWLLHLTILAWLVLLQLQTWACEFMTAVKWASGVNLLMTSLCSCHPHVCVWATGSSHCGRTCSRHILVFRSMFSRLD